MTDQTQTVGRAIPTPALDLLGALGAIELLRRVGELVMVPFVRQPPLVAVELHKRDDVHVDAASAESKRMARTDPDSQPS